MIRPIAVFAALAVPACSSLPAGVGAQEPAPEAPRTLHVNATAAVMRTPDQAVVELAVETVAATAGEATRANAQRMDRVLAAVRGLGVDPDRIRTLRIDLSPRYDRRRDATEPTITGYQASNRITVQLDSVELVGAVVDAAVEAGANRVAGIRFEIGDPQEAYYVALQRAIDQARREAEVAAAALGESLGPPTSVSTGGFSAPPAPRMEAMELSRAADVGTPVQPGEIEVRANVSITYRLGS
jgi:uncharacterized protein YggE